MDWPQIDNVLGIKPITDEKAQRRLWHIYRKRKEKKEKKEEETRKEKGGRIDIYA
ncbi:hypothetical protein [Persephonella sp.]